MVAADGESPVSHMATGIGLGMRPDRGKVKSYASHRLCYLIVIFHLNLDTYCHCIPIHVSSGFDALTPYQNLQDHLNLASGYDSYHVSSYWQMKDCLI